ncbi:serum paraoxonase/arylesterase 1-like [Ruditapes philippinarum]|uniref:serum paraoxonase/arylesterase 1-like n=1 Tax=Ruditapes philippinarum TaxID=129788 RepID=UPI00295AB8E2|nr:serum paraoxonase/arylesterase 1-like [Ruditapes philippinarum]
MFGSAAKLVFLGFILKQILDYRDWLDFDREIIFSVAPGKCRIVLHEGGSEDLTHIGNGVVVFSTGLEASEGLIKAVDLNKSLEAFTLNITNAPARNDFMSKPHGLSTWRDPNTGKRYLYVISHATEESIEAFEIEDDLNLRYLKTFTDSSFRFVNDLVVVGKDKFYTSQFAYCSIHDESYKINLEWLSHWKSGKVFYFDGHRARVVASNLRQPNGINVSPDGKVLYLAEWGAKTLRAYRRETSNNLVELWSTYLGTGIDNIEVQQDTGDLWIGSHPVMWKTISLINIFGEKLPGQALRIKMTDNAISEIEEVYSEDGNMLSGTSSATYVNGKLVIGTVSKKAAICDMDYLSDNGDSESDKLPGTYINI